MRFNNLTICCLLSFGTCTGTLAGNMSCAENTVTHSYLCFHNDKVRVNGDVRSTPFYKGGPKGVDDTGYTARVHCGTRVLELTDRKGVAFVRNVPTEQVGRDFVRHLCAHQKIIKDPKLSTQ